jgi:hypothetical protein
MLWRFMASPGLDLTNNTAERALRPYVIWRKTSFFSQSERGDLFRARVMTVAESCRRLNLLSLCWPSKNCRQLMTVAGLGQKRRLTQWVNWNLSKTRW